MFRPHFAVIFRLSQKCIKRVIILSGIPVSQCYGHYKILQYVGTPVYQTVRRHTLAAAITHPSQLSNCLCGSCRKAQSDCLSVRQLSGCSLFASDCSLTVTSSDWSSQWPHVWEGGLGQLRSVYIDENAVDRMRCISYCGGGGGGGGLATYMPQEERFIHPRMSFVKTALAQCRNPRVTVDGPP
jgi:hypothetical protein